MYEFHNWLNTIDTEVKFTLTWSREELQFLDTKVSVSGGKLHTSLFKKETDKNTLLKLDSCHPRRMVHSLPYGQMLQEKRIVSRNSETDEMLNTMAKGFCDKGYPQRLVDSHKLKVLGWDRQQLLKQKKTQKLYLVCPL